jgi:RAD50-interacting protein 1
MVFQFDMADRYSPLPNAAHRMDFLVSIQLPLLSQYQSRITSSLDAFETLSSAFVRVVPGALGRDPSRVSDSSTKRLTSGIEGVQRLCKALISSKYILNALVTWGEDLVSR